MQYIKKESFSAKMSNPLSLPASLVIPLFTLSLIHGVLMSSISQAQSPILPFVEEASIRGLDLFTNSGGSTGAGIALVDIDLDGDPDLISTNGGSNLSIFENDGSGFFIDRSPNSIPLGLQTMSCLALGDVDGDKDLDIFVGCYFAHDRLLLNQGNWQFTSTDWTPANSELDFTRTNGASLCDLNGDDWLDLIVACGSGTPIQNANRLFLNDGTGFFIPVDVPVLQLSEPTFQIMPFDYDLDGDLDLYVSNDRGLNLGFFNRFLINNNGTIGNPLTIFPSVAVDSMGVCVADLNLDAMPDIYVTSTADPHPLLINTGYFQYEDLSRDYGVNLGVVSWGCLFFDHGLDGDLDLLVADTNAPDRLYENGNATVWENIAPQTGLENPGFSACWVKGDIDGDGDIDLVNQSLWENLKVFVQQGTPTKNYFRFRPLYQPPNYHGIGSRIMVYAENMELIFSDQKTTGRNYKSESEWIFHHGVPEGKTITAVEVFYPDGSLRRFIDVPMNATWSLPHPFLLGDPDADRILTTADFSAMCSMRTTAQNPIQSGFEFFDFDGNFIIDELDMIDFIKKAEWGDQDCNGNGISDFIDIFSGFSVDSNGDRIPDECFPAFIRGDLNLDFSVDVGDSSLLLSFLFQNNPLPCLSAADLTRDNVIDLGDFACLAEFLFAGGPPPSSPYPDCGNPLTALSCEDRSCP